MTSPCEGGEWTEAEIRRVGYGVVDRIAKYLTRLPHRPVFQPVPSSVALSLLEEPAPAKGTPADQILDDFDERIAPYPFGNGHPRFHGWVNSPPAVMGILAEALAAAMNPSCAGGNHAAVYVERAVANWFKQILGFPTEAVGLLVSGGSMAGLTALAVARHVKAGFDVRAHGLQGARSRLVVYKGAEGHGCHQKAIEMLGLGSDNLRVVESDAAGRMRIEELEQAIRRDASEGHTPIAVVASAGTVNAGAIDPLHEIADVCARHGVWMHVDAAYGGPAILTGKYRGALSGLARADSIALDPHKWLCIPVEAGLVLVRDTAAMRDAFSLVPPYLRTDGDPAGVGGPPWLSEYGFQQTRGFRALKVWMTLKYHGVEGYKAAIERNIVLAERLAERVRQSPNLELLEPQSLSIVCFRFVPPHLSDDGAALDALNKALVERIQLGGDAFLSSTVMGGRFFLRACFVHPLTREADIDRLVELVHDTAARIA